MPTEIVIIAENVRLEGYLTDTPTARALADALPFEGQAHRWGDEIYFPVPQVVQDLDDTAAMKVDVGDLAYWPSGKAFCLFFGLTPTSVPGEIRPASAVNLVGKISGDPCCLGLIPEGATVRVERK
ncbi:MAG: cyclophilin-like fold protein [Deltaproteobacteria bacterium]|nr:cyclophilin-like fold protein [Deltaproteobacteria bacterium]